MGWTSGGAQCGYSVLSANALHRREHRLRRRLEALLTVILQPLTLVAIERLLQRGFHSTCSGGALYWLRVRLTCRYCINCISSGKWREGMGSPLVRFTSFSAEAQILPVGSPVAD